MTSHHHAFVPTLADVTVAQFATEVGEALGRLAAISCHDRLGLAEARSIRSVQPTPLRPDSGKRLAQEDFRCLGADAFEHPESTFEVRAVRCVFYELRHAALVFIQQAFARATSRVAVLSS
jgi:hypothetical protein